MGGRMLKSKKNKNKSRKNANNPSEIATKAPKTPIKVHKTSIKAPKTSIEIHDTLSKSPCAYVIEITTSNISFYAQYKAFSLFGPLRQMDLLSANEAIQKVRFKYDSAPTINDEKIYEASDQLIREANIFGSEQTGEDLPWFKIGARSPHLKKPKRSKNILRKLNDDCLRAIFKDLPAMDLCELAFTCKRLRRIAVDLMRVRYCNHDEMSFDDLISNGYVSFEDAKRFTTVFGPVIPPIRSSTATFDETTMFLGCLNFFCFSPDLQAIISRFERDQINEYLMLTHGLPLNNNSIYDACEVTPQNVLKYSYPAAIKKIQQRSTEM